MYRKGIQIDKIVRYLWAVFDGYYCMSCHLCTGLINKIHKSLRRPSAAENIVQKEDLLAFDEGNIVICQIHPLLNRGSY